MEGRIEALVGSLRQAIPGELSWVATLLQRVLHYLAGPLLDQSGRYPWFGLLAALLLTGWVFWTGRVAAERRGLGGFLGFCFPRGIWRHPSTLVDVKVGFCNAVLIGNALNLTWRFNAALVASLVTGLLAGAFGPGVQQAGTWGPVPVLLLTLAMSLTDDLGYYLFHRASHVFAPLWAIHKLHHSAEVMSPLTAARVHPLERAILGPFRAVTNGLIMGPLLYLHAGEVALTTVLGLQLAVLLFHGLGHVLHHSHVRVYFGPAVGRVIVSPLQHQVHHSCLPPHLDRNFAEHWAVWDTLLGTLYLPKVDEPLRFGLAGYRTQPHHGLLSAYAVPVVEACAATVALLRRGWRRPSPVRPEG